MTRGMDRSERVAREIDEAVAAEAAQRVIAGRPPMSHEDSWEVVKAIFRREFQAVWEEAAEVCAAEAMADEPLCGNAAMLQCAAVLRARAKKEA